MRRLDPKLKTALTIIIAFALMRVSTRYGFALPPEVREAGAALLVGYLVHLRRGRRARPMARAGVRFRPRLHIRNRKGRNRQ